MLVEKSSTSTNTILQRGRNESSWKELLILAKDIPVDVRFLELMQIGEGKEGETISNTTLFKKNKIYSKHK